jgi:hypothetical protein
MDGIVPWYFAELFHLIRLLPSWQSDKSGVMDPFVDTPATEGKPKKKLLDQIRDVMRLKHYSLRTECRNSYRILLFVVRISLATP